MVTQKMIHSVLQLKSVVGVQSYFSGSTWLGQIPKFFQKLDLKAPLTHEQKKTLQYYTGKKTVLQYYTSKKTLQYYTGISGNVSSFNWKLEDNRWIFKQY